MKARSVARRSRWSARRVFGVLAGAGVIATGAASVVAGFATPAMASAPVDVRGTYTGTATQIDGSASSGQLTIQFTTEDLGTGAVQGVELSSGTNTYQLSGWVEGSTVLFTATDGGVLAATPPATPETSSAPLPALPSLAIGASAWHRSLSLPGSLTLTADGHLAGTQTNFNNTISNLSLARLSGAQANAAAASVDGVWRLTVTVTSIQQGAKAVPLGDLAMGHVGTVTVRLTSACGAICTVVVTSVPAGALEFADPSGFVGLGDQALRRVGATMEYQTGGFGTGPCTTPPPPFGLSLLLTVTATGKTADGQLHATGLSGEERTVTVDCAGDTVDRGLTINDATFVPAAQAQPPAASAGAGTPTAVQPTPADPARVPTHASFEHITSGPAPIARALPSISQAFSPGAVVASAAITLAFLLFITFPANLFNKTFEENYEEIRLWWRRPLARLSGGALATRGSGFVQRMGAWRTRIAFGVVVVLGAILGALLNPGFGANSASAEGLAATLICVLFGAAVGAVVTGTYRRMRGHEITWHVEALPAGLLVAAGCVLLSRLSDFQPGYLYGIVCGVAFAGTLAKHENGHLVALSHLVTIGTSVVAWLAWAPVNHAAIRHTHNPLLAIADDVLASIFAGGLVGTVVSLIPVRFMPGHTLVSWHRGAWAGVFGLATFGVVDILVRPQHANHSGRAPVVTIIVLFVVFAGGSLVFRYYFERRAKAREAADAVPATAAVPEQSGPVDDTSVLHADSDARQAEGVDTERPSGELGSSEVPRPTT